MKGMHVSSLGRTLDGLALGRRGSYPFLELFNVSSISFSKLGEGLLGDCLRGREGQSWHKFGDHHRY